MRLERAGVLFRSLGSFHQRGDVRLGGGEAVFQVRDVGSSFMHFAAKLADLVAHPVVEHVGWHGEQFGHSRQIVAHVEAVEAVEQGARVARVEDEMLSRVNLNCFFTSNLNLFVVKYLKYNA